MPPEVAVKLGIWVATGALDAFRSMVRVHWRAPPEVQAPIAFWQSFAEPEAAAESTLEYPEEVVVIPNADAAAVPQTLTVARILPPVEPVPVPVGDPVEAPWMATGKESPAPMGWLPERGARSCQLIPPI